MHCYVALHIVIKVVADSLVGQVLAKPLCKNKIPFYKKEVIDKSTRMIFGLVQLATVDRKGIR